MCLLFPYFIDLNLATLSHNLNMYMLLKPYQNLHKQFSNQYPLCPGEGFIPLKMNMMKVLKLVISVRHITHSRRVSILQMYEANT